MLRAEGSGFRAERAQGTGQRTEKTTGQRAQSVIFRNLYFIFHNLVNTNPVKIVAIAPIRVYQVQAIEVKRII